MSSTTNTNSTSSHHRRRRQVQVGFSKRTQVYLVPALSEYTDEELDACFTTEDDTTRNQDDLIYNVKSARVHGIHAEGICIRGLEYLADPALHQESRSTKRNHCDAVLDEQDRQWDAGVFPTDMDSIAEASLQSSRESIDRAQMMGAQDAVAIRRIRQTDEAAERRRRSSIVSLSGDMDRRRSSIVSLSGGGDDAVATTTATSTAVAANLRGHRRCSSASGPPTTPFGKMLLERVNIGTNDGGRPSQDVAN